MSRFSGQKILFTGAVVFVVAATIYGFFVVGSPSKERGIMLDSQKVNNLITIASAIDNFYDLKRRLPENLTEIESDRSYYLPQGTTDGILYKKGEGNKFELCATFSDRSVYEGRWAESAPVQQEDRSWYHEAGDRCYELRARGSSIFTMPANGSSGCQLMKNTKTAEVKCFGCSGKTCATPATSEWENFEFAKGKDSVGIPYSCVAAANGCELVQ